MLTGALCFLWLVGVTACLDMMVYFLRVAKATREVFAGQGLMNDETETLLDKVASPVAMKNATTAMTAAPLAGLLILYITFRAKTQLIEDDNREYMTVQFGMALITMGILARAGNAFNCRVESPVFGNLSEIFGGAAMYTGYFILLAGLAVVKSDAYTLSTAGLCFASLAVFVLACLLLLVAIPTFSWLNITSRDEDEKQMSRIQDVQAAASFAPMVMLVFFYIHFLPWSSSEELPSMTDDVVIATTIGVFTQGFGVMLKVYQGESGWAVRLGSFIRLSALMITYAGFAACLYCASLIDQPSAATSNFVLLMIPIALMKLLVVLIQEFSTQEYTKGLIDNTTMESIQSSQKLLQVMLDGLSQAMLVSLLLLYVHFYAELFMGISGAEYIKNWKGLEQAMYMLTLSLYVLMLVDLLKSIKGEMPGNSFVWSIVTVFTFFKFVMLFTVVLATLWTE